MYIYQKKGWPNFTWDEQKLKLLLPEVRHLQGRLLGRMHALGFASKEEAALQILTEDVVKTSAIENEKLDKDQVRSSIASKLGMDVGGSAQQDRNVDGIVEVMLDATRNYNKTLTAERLFNWHGALFPTGRSGLSKIVIGGWRTKESGDMEIISGAYGKEKIHYKAPDYSLLKKEMEKFLKWFEKKDNCEPVLKAALAHFWFVSIHPFDDGNGRIARAITDMQLSRSEDCNQRFYSMSSQIKKERKEYYEVLETCQKGTLDITPWVEWFLSCLKRSIANAEITLSVVLTKANFWNDFKDQSFNHRQKKILNLLLDGFEGKLTSSKWALITKCSQDTANRDINDLISKQILEKDKLGGRSTSYYLVQDH